METWRNVKDYECLYQVSNYGRVRSLDRESSFGKSMIVKKGKMRTPIEDKDGYYKVGLFKEGKRKNYFIHRLVAENFIENPDSLPVVNHIDGNKKNNHMENLEWCTRSENDLHAFKLGLRKPTDGGTSKRVAKIDPNTDLILEIYNSLSEASRNNDISVQSISYCVNGRTNHSRGYKWAFVDKGVTTIENTL